MEATTSRGLGFHYHLARIYFTQAESKNGAPCRRFDLIKRFRLTIQTNGKRTEEGTCRKGRSSHTWAEMVYPTNVVSDLVAIMRGLVSGAWIYHTRSKHSQMSRFPTSLALPLRILASFITLLPGDSSSHVLILRIF